MSAADSYRIGVDVGGTFTDCAGLRPDGTVVLEKAPTTPDDQSQGVLDAIAALARAEGLTDASALLARTTTIVHGTTAGDNAMIQMSGAPTGLIVTAGFHDEIEMRRCFKEDIWDPALPAPEPIARRRVRIGVAERITAEGDIDTPLDEEAVRAAARRLDRFGVTSIAIVFVHSYRNPVHELHARELVREELPDVELISLSHEVYAKPPEFERTSTTLVNAYVGPPIVRYLARLSERLAWARFTGELLLATSAGGVATPAAIERKAVATIGSGPTGGVTAAARAASAAGLHDVVSVDMGGTSYDVCLVRGGRPEVTSDWNWRHRYCIALPMVDIHSIGAGGGSIIRVTDGVLYVGPASAGSYPGPVAYGRGGTEPTITDADLVLGRLDAAGFWRGRLPLDVGAAVAALARVGAPLGLDAEEVAVAASRIVDAHMTDAIRRVLSLAGTDPRELALVAFGGMGAVHATTQAAALGMTRVLVPRDAPALSAVGLMSADHVVDDVEALTADWRAIDAAELSKRARALLDRAVDAMRDAGVPDPQVSHEWLLNLVYPGQTFDTALPIEVSADGEVTAAAVAQTVEEFHRRNESARLIEARAQEPSVRGIRLVTTGHVPHPGAVSLAPAIGAPEPTGRRRLHAGGTWHDDAAVYRLDDLAPGPAVSGPAVLAGAFTTLVLRPGDVATRLDDGDVLVEVGG